MKDAHTSPFILVLFFSVVLVLVTACSPEANEAGTSRDSIKRVLAKSQESIEADQPGEAIRRLEKLHEEHPKNVEVAWALAEAYEAAEDHFMAAVSYEEVFRLADSRPEALERAAKAYKNDGMQEQTLNAYNRLHQKYPERITYARKLARLYAQNDQNQKAYQVYKQAHQSQPEPDLQDAARLGNLARMTGNPKEAVAFYRQCLQLAEKENRKAPVAALGGLFDLSVKAEKHEQATQYYEILKKRVPDQLHRLSMHEAYQKQMAANRSSSERSNTGEKTEENSGKEKTQRVVDLPAPSEGAQTEPPRDVSKTKETITKSDTASKSQTNSDSDAPSSSPSTDRQARDSSESSSAEPAQLNNRELQNGQPPPSTQNSENQSTRDAPSTPNVPRDTPSRDSRASEENRTQQDRADDPQEVQISKTEWFNRANEHLDKGSPSDAIQYAWQALNSDPDYAAGWAVLSKAYRADKQFTKAESTILEALRMDPENVKYRLQYLSILKQYRSDQALFQALKEAYQAHPESPEIIFQLANGYARIKNNEQRAFDLYVKFLEIAPQHPYQQKVEQSIRELYN